jgi:hypothetical protein
MVAEVVETNFVKAIHHCGHREFLYLAKTSLLKELQNAVLSKATTFNSLK